jgi:hypothetical protein
MARRQRERRRYLDAETERDEPFFSPCPLFFAVSITAFGDRGFHRRNTEGTEKFNESSLPSVFEPQQRDRVAPATASTARR